VPPVAPASGPVPGRAERPAPAGWAASPPPLAARNPRGQPQSPPLPGPPIVAAPSGPPGRIGSSGPASATHGWGGPVWAAGPPAGPPRRGPVRWLIPLVLVLAMAAGAGGTGVFLLVRSDDGPAEAVRSYLTDVRAGRYDAAYDRLCSSVRGNRSATEYTIIMRALDGISGGIASFAVRGMQTRHAVAAETVREVQVDVQRGDDPTSRESYQVGRESGDYCLLTPGAPFTAGAGGGTLGVQPPGPFGGLPDIPDDGSGGGGSRGGGGSGGGGAGRGGLDGGGPPGRAA
ncbi:hypothetical protein, partial [Frankia tisae]